MSYPCHYTNLCPHKPHKHAHTHTHTHTHTHWAGRGAVGVSVPFESGSLTIRPRRPTKSSSILNMNQFIIIVMKTTLADCCAVGYHSVVYQITFKLYAIFYLHIVKMSNPFNLGELVNSVIKILNLRTSFLQL